MTFLKERTRAFGSPGGTLYNLSRASDVTKPRDGINYSPYFPAAGLYSLFRDSFGPMPYMKFGDGVW